MGPGRTRAVGRRLIVAGLFAAAIACALIVAVAGATTPWQSGATQESTITDCGSIILGSPMSSPGAAVTPYVNEDYNNPPVVGQVYYLAVTVFGIGNSCSQMAADIQFALPSATTPEISAATPVICLPLQPDASNTQIVNGPPDTSAGCPQSGTPTGNNTYRFDMPVKTGVFATSFFPFWPVPQGFGVELHVPVVSSGPLGAGTKATAVVTMADGNNNPTLSPSVPVIVGPAPTSPPTPGPQSVTNAAASNITNTSATLSANFVFNFSNTPGTPEIDWGRTNSYDFGTSFNPLFANQVPYEGSYSVNLTGLQPGCTYHWRAVMSNGIHPPFDQTPDMTFTATGSGGSCSSPPSAFGQGSPTIYNVPPSIPTIPIASGLTPPHTATTTTTTTTTTTPVVPPKPDVSTVGSLKTKGNSVLVTVNCTGAAMNHCTDSLALSVTETLRSGKVIAITARRGRKITHKTVVVGSTTVTLAGGQSKLVSVILNAIGKRLLANVRTARLRLTVLQSVGAQRVLIKRALVTLRSRRTHKPYR